MGNHLFQMTLLLQGYFLQSLTLIIQVLQTLILSQASHFLLFSWLSILFTCWNARPVSSSNNLNIITLSEVICFQGFINLPHIWGRILITGTVCSIFDDVVTRCWWWRIRLAVNCASVWLLLRLSLLHAISWLVFNELFDCFLLICLSLMLILECKSTTFDLIRQNCRNMLLTLIMTYRQSLKTHAFLISQLSTRIYF